MLEYPVQVLAEGRSFEIEVRREPLDPLPEELAVMVEENWDRVRRTDPGIPDTPLLCVKNCAVDLESGKIELVCDPSSRKVWMGTMQPSVATRWPGHIRRSISMLAVTVSSDDVLILGVRKPKITYPLQRHVVPAGRLQVKELDPLNGIRIEFGEELGLSPEDYPDLTCIGLVTDMVVNGIEFIFSCRTRLTAAEVFSCARNAASADEHCVLEPFPWEARFIRDNVMLPEPEAFPPTGFAGLALALRRSFGSDVFPPWRPVAREYEEFMGRRLDLARLKK